MPHDFDITHATPSVDDYRRLRLAAGMSDRSPASVAAGLPNTFFGVVARVDGQVVGMGRIIGDGGTAFQLVDIAVEPAFQGRGIGKAIVARLVDHLNTNAPKGAYVSLIADGNAHYLYAKFGFQPTAPASIGMAYFVQ